MKNKVWISINDKLNWIKKYFKSFAIIFSIIFFVGILTFWTIDFCSKKNDNSNPINYIINSFVVSKDTIYQDKTNRKVISEHNLNNEESNPSECILNDTANVISHTSNLLTYLTLFFAVIGIVAGVGIYKYSTSIHNLKQETENLKNKTLDAGLTTIAAVPLVEATQITSDAYNLAIETITQNITENRGEVEKNPKYSKLFIVEALDYWNRGDYKHAANILEKALDLSYKDGNNNTMGTINYHLARVYKQMFYEEICSNDVYEYPLKSENWENKTAKEYYDEVNKYVKGMGDAFASQKKVISLSIASILYYYTSTKSIELLKERGKRLIKELENCIDKQKVITDFASWTAFTVVATYKKEGQYENNELYDGLGENYYAKESLRLFEDSIHSQSGANIKMSWYRTMAQLAAKGENKVQQMEDYKSLAKFYVGVEEQKMGENNKLRIFNPYLLIEEKNSAEVIRKEIDEIGKIS